MEVTSSSSNTPSINRARAFARIGGKRYGKPEADRASDLTIGFFKKYLG